MRNNFLIGRWAVAAVAVVGLATFAASANGQSLSGVGNDATILLFGGTGNPAAEGMERQLDGQPVDGAAEIKRVLTPQQFAPIYGERSYDDSRNEGVVEAKTAILEAQAEGGPVVVTDYSQSASVTSQAFDELARENVPLDNVRVVHVANPRTPVTGLEARLAGVAIPGVTALGSAPDVVDGYSICWVQDPIGNAPEAGRLLDPLVALNAWLGYNSYHSRYADVDLAATSRSYERDGMTYITLDDGKTPIIEEMHRSGIYLPENLENGIRDHVSGSDHHGPGPVAPAASPAPVAVPEAPVTPVAAVETVQELPFTPVETVQQEFSDFVETSQEFVAAVTQPQPVYEDVSPAPSQMKQVSTTIDNTANAVKNDVVLQQVIPAPVVDQVAAGLQNLVGQLPR